MSTQTELGEAIKRGFQLLMDDTDALTWTTV